MGFTPVIVPIARKDSSSNMVGPSTKTDVLVFWSILGFYALILLVLILKFKHKNK